MGRRPHAVIQTKNAVHNGLRHVSEPMAMDNLNVGSLSEPPVVRTNNLMHMYVKRGSIVDARNLFDNMLQRDVVSWNIMILGYAKQEQGAWALKMYAQMHEEGVRPTARTFVGALKACSSLAAQEHGNQVHGKFVKTGCLEKGRAIHSQAVEYGFESDLYVGNTLVDMYRRCGSMQDAGHVFEELPHHDVVSWNAMILAHSKQEEGALALNLYAEMRQKGITPDRLTFVGAFKACSSLATLVDEKQDHDKIIIECLEKGRAIHSQAVKSGFESDVFAATTLVDMYVKCGSMGDARRVFDLLPHRNVVSWNAMIMGYGKQEGVLALDLYAQMQQELVPPDDRTFVAALKACSSLAALEGWEQIDGKSIKLGSLEKGRGIHSQVIKSGFDLDVYVGTTLMDMYTNCGNMEDARRVFDELPHCNEITWTTMILGYAENEESEEAFRLFARMQEQGLPTNSLTFVAILKACGNTSALKTGYARQGDSELVFNLFERMTREGIQPNGLTFLSVLIACSHVGQVDKGQKYFQSMRNQYGIMLTIEHYTCMVDLLGRAGQVDKAVGMVDKMPFQPDIFIWLTVLGACQKWKNLEVGKHAFQNIMRIDDKLPVAYVLMANIYADAHKWEDFNKIEVMRQFKHRTQDRAGRMNSVDCCVYLRWEI